MLYFGSNVMMDGARAISSFGAEAEFKKLYVTKIVSIAFWQYLEMNLCVKYHSVRSKKATKTIRIEVFPFEIAEEKLRTVGTKI